MRFKSRLNNNLSFLIIFYIYEVENTRISKEFWSIQQHYLLKKLFGETKEVPDQTNFNGIFSYDIRLASCNGL